MPKSDTWPGGVTMDSLSNLASARSCDSVTSVNSGYSEDSMEHLSAEERACLMYLEETIEALEVQEDSGFSNDEPDYCLEAGYAGGNDVSHFMSDESVKSESGSRVFAMEDNAEHQTPDQTSKPQSSIDPAELLANLVSPSKPSNTDAKSHQSATPLCVSTDGNGNLKIVPLASLGQSTEEADADVIPPPLDFMDQPGLPPQTQTVKSLPYSAGVSNTKPGPIDLEQLRQRASAKRPAVSSSVPPNKPPDLSLPAVTSDPPMTPPPDSAELRSPPIVAPRPKKLPTNIILKSHKAAMADGTLEHLGPTSSDRLMLDPQRVRMEALRKLGLLPAEADSGPALSPKLSPKTRRSWAAPASPLSPRALRTPPSTPPVSRVNGSPPAYTPPAYSAPLFPVVLPSAASVDEPAEVLPAPAAFSDPIGPPPSDNEPSAVNAQVSTPPLTPSSLLKHLTPPKGVKSATLEHSGLGLSTVMSSQDSNEANQPRMSQPRPASLGNAKEFTSAGGEVSQAGRATAREPDSRRSLPPHNAFHHSRDTQKLPRSQGISVLISPRPENEADRREALRKLGLLRD